MQLLSGKKDQSFWSLQKQNATHGCVSWQGPYTSISVRQPLLLTVICWALGFQDSVCDHFINIVNAWQNYILSNAIKLLGYGANATPSLYCMHSFILWNMFLECLMLWQIEALTKFKGHALSTAAHNYWNEGSSYFCAIGLFPPRFIRSQVSYWIISFWPQLSQCIPELSLASPQSPKEPLGHKS